MTIVPYTYDNADDIDHDSMPFPVVENQFAGEKNEVDTAWEPTDAEWFVDHSGFGSPGESALTIDQFIPLLTTYVEQNPGHGFVITDVGQFQLYIRAYRRR